MTEIDINLSSWMAHTDISSKKLSELLLPGSHDSGAYKISAELTPNKDKILGKKIAGKDIGLSKGFLANRSLVKNWTITQEHSIKEQLEKGIRLLDFRVSNAGTAEKPIFVLSHTFGCCEYEQAIKEVRDFLAENPSEVVVISASLDAENKNTMVEVEEKFIELTKKTLSNHLAPVSNHDDIISNLSGKVVYQYEEAEGRPITNTEGLIKSGKGILKDIWPNITDADKLNSKIKQDYKKEAEGLPAFASHVLTPNISMIAKNPFSSIKSSSKKVEKPLREMLHEIYQEDKKQNSNDVKHLRGLTLDFPTDEMVKSIVLLNHLRSDLKKGKDTLAAFDPEDVKNQVITNTIKLCKELSADNKVTAKALHEYVNKVVTSLRPLSIKDPEFDLKRFSQGLYKDLRNIVMDKGLLKVGAGERLKIIVSRTWDSMKGFFVNFIGKKLGLKQENSPKYSSWRNQFVKEVKEIAKQPSFVEKLRQARHSTKTFSNNIRNM